MNEKGVSPLVATVMLVTIVVVISFLVFWWYGEYIGESLQKSEITAEQACLNDISFSLSDPGCLENTTVVGEKIIYFDVENNGNFGINSFKAKVDGAVGVEFVTIPQSVDQSVETKLSFTMDTTLVGTDLVIEITPMAKAGGVTKYCTTKTKSIVVDCS
jgi:flagellin-like protein